MLRSLFILVFTFSLSTQATVLDASFIRSSITFFESIADKIFPVEQSIEDMLTNGSQKLSVDLISDVTNRKSNLKIKPSYDNVRKIVHFSLVLSLPGEPKVYQNFSMNLRNLSPIQIQNLFLEQVEILYGTHLNGSTYAKSTNDLKKIFINRLSNLVIPSSYAVVGRPTESNLTLMLHYGSIMYYNKLLNSDDVTDSDRRSLTTLIRYHLPNIKTKI